MRLALTVLPLFALTAAAAHAEWRPADGPVKTRWAKDVNPDRPLPEYPRPQMVREKWQNLNGLWEYAIQAKDDAQPKRFAGEILVPFPVESALSGVMKRVGPEQRLWYRRRFSLDPGWSGQRLLLHFGAVDWETHVWVNGREVGEHHGGYDPFTFDISDALTATGEQEIVVSVWDPSDAGPQPRGKQVNNPGGIFYTPTTGIWQTVWLEPVPKTSIRSLKIVPDLDGKQVKVTVTCDNGADARVTATVTGASAGDKQQPIKPVSAVGRPGEELKVPVSTVHAWSPAAPWLYDLQVSIGPADKPVDRVTSYFGLRKVSLGPDKNGITRILLNDKPLFMFGPLDQGFWPDGLYTAPTDEALRYDVEWTLRVGCNMCRKHVKVEPARWYYWCDKLGLLVWQDMPSGDASVGPGKGEIERTPESAGIYEHELKAMLDALHNVPSIVMWVVFNEGWGQFDTTRITKWTKQYDGTRLVNCASGWNDFPVGDVHDIHNYPAPASPEPEPARAAVLGEYGGLGLPLKGHTWLNEKNWGYRSYPDKKALAEAYFGLLFGLRQLIGEPGLSAAVYTQTTDVETEVNGLLTYDRAIAKIPEERLAAAHERLYLPPPKLRPAVPTSQETASDWRYTTKRPSDDWMKAGFDDSSWRLGPAGFGTKQTPGTVVRTEWDTSDIWIRRTFDQAASGAGEGLLNDPHLMVHHDEDAEIYINGVLAASLPGYTVGYGAFPMREEARAAIRAGKNVLAVHCKQTGGGQYIDVGIVDVVEEEGTKPNARKAD
ncbi:MAG TPA: glycoside hydrolase family 2 TIM barrel-domain containing protein [Pirellulales bacterium]|nr:glycoside hydrolase family 2 TIM barrel-domain containing protein [Pirellulales bacterium]